MSIPQSPLRAQNLFGNAFFRHTWRKYQKEVLEELEIHLGDKHLNIVAAPGSGKTLLGLEVMLRINKPTIILTPSIAIRNQWATRFTQDFLLTDQMPDWISFDVRNPKLLTIVTYQALHAAFSDGTELNDEELIEEENQEIKDDTAEKNITTSKADIVISQFLAQHIETIIIDEAHHLRNAWWDSLLYVKEHMQSVHIVSLTATPPYDVSPTEWKNYESLCGPVDAEISVPELVLEKNLCPHQDFVYFNALSPDESRVVKSFRDHVDEFRSRLVQNKALIDILIHHPHIVNPALHNEIIFSNPEYYVSVLSFLHTASAPIPRPFLRMMTSSTGDIQSFSLQFIEIFLQNLIYKDQYVSINHKAHVESLRKELYDIGAIERKTVMLTDNTETKRLCAESINKNNSILDIVKTEHESLGQKLRMVILTDYIRKELWDTREVSSKLGVVPIFENIRKSFHGTKKIGILSGSLVVIPASAQEKLADLSNLSLVPLESDQEYIQVIARGNNDSIVHLITQLFNAGDIEILVGTKSLLGEGWDAPSINSLILASFVGSFMLSNQMRGRAIRIDKENPNKVSNIWHLISVEDNREEAGYDFSILQRRFKAFVGISVAGKTIENGLERLGLGLPPFNESYIEAKNLEMTQLAKNRDKIRSDWNFVLEHGDVKKMIQELKAERNVLPKKFVLYNTLYSLFWRSVAAGAYFFFQNLQAAGKILKELNPADARTLILYVFAIPLFITLPGLFKTLWLFLRNGSIENNMQRVGEVVMRSLIRINIIKTPVDKLYILANRGGDGTISCGLEGATVYEKSVFIDCLEEITNPIQNPRYILTRQSKLNFFLRNDYHAVPEILATKKGSAEFFAKLWGKYIGANRLVYTRNYAGRILLLKARKKALSTQFQKRSERIETWK